MTGSWVIDYFLYGCVILIAVPLAAFLYFFVFFILFSILFFNILLFFKFFLFFLEPLVIKLMFICCFVYIYYSTFDFILLLFF